MFDDMLKRYKVTRWKGFENGECQEIKGGSENVECQEIKGVYGE